MPEVTALHSFDHNGVKRRGQVWDASESETVQLERAGLVKRRDNTAIPPKATGKKLSASPAVPASPKQTLCHGSSLVEAALQRGAAVI